MTASPHSILEFWFGEPADESLVASRQAALWWQKQPALDALIKSRFEALLESAMSHELEHCLLSAQGRLALIILLDQFPRNMYRDTAAAFACDQRAREYCLVGLEQGDDLRLTPLQRVFFYLPLEHAEDRDLQQRSVALYQSLVQSTRSAGGADLSSYLDFAIKHQQIIERFGRFPHRNSILGRVSSAQELAFLTQPGSSF